MFACVGIKTGLIKHKSSMSFKLWFLSPSNSPWTHYFSSSFPESSDVPTSSADSLSAADDPPLENLMREPRGSVTSIQGPPIRPPGLLGSGASGLMGAQSQDGGESCGHNSDLRDLLEYLEKQVCSEQMFKRQSSRIFGRN